MSVNGGNIGEVSDDDGSGDDSSLWDDIAPAWVKNLKTLGTAGVAAISTVAAFAEDPIEFLREKFLVIVVDAILSAWSIFLELVDDMVGELVTIPEEAIFTPLADVVIALIGIGDGVATSMLTNIEAELETFGLLAPFAPLLALLVTTVTFATIGVALWRIAETYLPVEAVTDSVKTSISSVLALVPGGNNE